MPLPAGSLGGQAAPPAHQHSSSSEDSRTEDLLQALGGKSKALRKQEQNRQAQQRHRAKAKVCTFGGRFSNLAALSSALFVHPASALL